MTLRERFWSKVEVGLHDQCWEWIGGTNSGGYGMFYVDGRICRAHRVVYELIRGPIPEDLCVCHHCDNPGCVNPAHLFLGTHMDNMIDRGRKGRASGGALHGEKHSNAKLTEADVRTIRRVYRNGDSTQQEIADVFGISHNHVSSIVNRLRWDHVKSKGRNHG